MLVPNKMQHVLCTGNIGCKKEYERLRELAPNIHIVGGDYEYNTSSGSTTTAGQSTNRRAPTPSFAETKVIQVGEFRIGLIHGHQVIPWGDHMALAMIRRKLDVDILISGHTHKNEVVEHEGCWHINPVSYN